MAGNVWEWRGDLYRPDAYERRVVELGPGGVAQKPKGPDSSLDPRNPYEPESRVHRGGSFLCHDSYCASYRPSARMACPLDTGLQHRGFRCVKSPEPGAKQGGRQANLKAPPASANAKESGLEVPESDHAD